MSIFDQAINAFGEEKQFGQAIEEAAELIVAIRHYLRKRNNAINVIEECVDVELMLEQMKAIFKDENDLWERFRQSKLNRLARLIKEDGENI